MKVLVKKYLYKKGGDTSPKTSHCSFLCGCCLFNMETKKGTQKGNPFKKVYASVVMYKLVKAHILYIKNIKCQIM